MQKLNITICRNVRYVLLYSSIGTVLPLNGNAIKHITGVITGQW